MKSIYLIPIAACFSLALTGASYAQQKKVSTEQAWATCMKEVDKSTPRTDKNDAARTAAFKACMARLGHASGG